MAESTGDSLDNNAINSNCCIFNGYLESCTIGNEYADTELTAKRKQTVIIKSRKRNDALCKYINEQKLIYHKLCYLAYTSDEKIEEIK